MAAAEVATDAGVAMTQADVATVVAEVAVGMAAVAPSGSQPGGPWTETATAETRLPESYQTPPAAPESSPVQRLAPASCMSASSAAGDKTSRLNQSKIKGLPMLATTFLEHQDWMVTLPVVLGQTNSTSSRSSGLVPSAAQS